MPHLLLPMPMISEEDDDDADTADYTSMTIVQLWKRVIALEKREKNLTEYLESVATSCNLLMDRALNHD